MANNVNIFGFELPSRLRSAVKPLISGQLGSFEKFAVPLFRQAMSDYMEDTVITALNDTSIKNRTGRMAKSLVSGIKVRGSGRIDALSGTYRGIWYAKNHEFGKTIRPTNAKVLTIPLPAALRADGTPKLKGPTSWKRYGTFSYTGKSGQGYLVYKNAAEKLVFLYMYVDVVKLLPKLGLRKAHFENLDNLIGELGQVMAAGMVNTNLYDYAIGKDSKLRVLGIPAGVLTKRTIRPRFIRTKG